MDRRTHSEAYIDISPTLDVTITSRLRWGNWCEPETLVHDFLSIINPHVHRCRGLHIDAGEAQLFLLVGFICKAWQRL